MNLSGLNSPPLVAKVSISKNRYPAACGGEVHPRILIEQPEYSYSDPNAGTDTYFYSARKKAEKQAISACQLGEDFAC